MGCATSCCRQRREDIAGYASSPGYLSGTKTLEFKITAFESRLEKNGVTTDYVDCHGYSWRLRVYPFGKAEDAEMIKYISLYLICKQEDVTAKFRLRVLNEKKYNLRALNYDFPKGRSCGYTRMMTRDEAIAVLDSKGSFIVHVDIQVLEPKGRALWKPEESIQKELSQSYHASKLTDVTFCVNGDTIQAHRLIIALRCPNLLEVTKPDDTIIIDSVKPEAFKMMVDFMYEGSLPKMDLEKKMDLVSVADRFEYINLKLWLEADIVESNNIASKNAASVLLFADAHSCALLKEASMSFIEQNSGKVMADDDGWKNLKESDTLLLQVLERKPKDHREISQLRERLSKKGLDTDGTKEMLLKRLNDSEEAEMAKAKKAN